MLKFWHKNKHNEPAKTRQSTQPSNTDTTSTGSNQPASTKANQLPLYDTPGKLNVELFYRIMETRDLSLLLINTSQELNENESLKLATRLNNVWMELQEFYYNGTNKQGFKKFKESLKRVIKLETELLACKAAFQLVELGDESGYEILQHFKISSQDPKKIRGAILRRETKLDFARGDLEKKSASDDKKEALTFYKMVAGVERQLNRQLDIDKINLERWVAYIDDIRQKNEAEKQEVAKQKAKRH